jgi:DNA mismatch repair protein MutL
METIRELPPHIAEKIAAGEVVTGPASAVKELMENSMDAGARAITVEIKNGGKSLIRVSDDGGGIPAEQLRTAFLRHATSKLRDLADLDRIGSFGFRGEALTSIAAVSRLELYTKTAAAGPGAMIRIEGGEVVLEKSVGTAEGTTVVVSDLFYNTPARLKFLKSDRAEGARVVEAVSVLALGSADIKVRLVNNGAILFSTPGRGDLLANILTIYGGTTGRDLLPVNAANGDFSLNGLIASPASHRAGRGRRIFFINGRAVRSRLMEKALADACAETPLANGCPVAILFLRVPPERLDVNIHPAKSEVRFADEAALSDFVSEALRSALRVKEAVPTIPPREQRFILPAAEGVAPVTGEQTTLAGIGNADTGAKRTEAGGSPQTDGRATRLPDEEDSGSQELYIKNLLSSVREKDTFASVNLLREDAAVYQYAEGEYCAEPIRAGAALRAESPCAEAQPAGAAGSKAPHPEGQARAPFDIGAIAPIGCIFSTYIAGRDADSFYFIDQHAAHERVLYERFLRQRRGGEKLCQQLISPLVLELPHAARATTEKENAEMRVFLEGLGYEAEDFGKGACKINAVPAFLPLSEAEDFLHLLLAALPEGRPPRDVAAAERVISSACKAAVKAGDRLGDEEISGLFADLAACENPYACPHGRPVFIRLTRRDIERLFKRR